MLSEWALLKKYNIDVQHHHFMSHHGYILCTACRLLGIPFMLSLHGSDIFRPFESWIYNISRFFMHRSDAIFSCSNKLKEAAIRTYSRWQDRIITIYHGVDMSPTPTDTIANDQNLIVTVGGLDPIKGFDVLIQAAKIIQSQRPDLNIEVNIVGGGAYKETLSSLIHKLGIGNYVFLLGEYKKPQVAEILSKATLYVQPSHQESFPISILEAMACKKAVVATNVGGVSEMVEDGVTGCLIEKNNPERLAERIIYLLDNKDIRDNMAHKAFDRSQKDFSWQPIAEQYISTYHQTSSIIKHRTQQKM